MNKIYVILLCLIITQKATGQTSIYHPFPDSNAIWRIDLVDFSDPWNTFYYSYQYFTIGDTVLSDSSHWSKVYASGYSPTSTGYSDSVPYALIRNDTINKKVYYNPSFPNPPGTCLCDSLLFDFTLSPGDTIPDDWAAIYSGDHVVISGIDSVLIDNQWRQEILAVDSIFWNYNFVLIDGIGSSMGIFEPLIQFETNSQLVCMIQNGITIYPYLNAPCHLLHVGLDDEPKIISSVDIYPNPFSDQLHINSGKLKNHQLKKVMVYNMVGKNIFESEINGPDIILELPLLPDGIYLLVMKNELGQFFQKKIIKM